MSGDDDLTSCEKTCAAKCSVYTPVACTAIAFARKRKSRTFEQKKIGIKMSGLPHIEFLPFLGSFVFSMFSPQNEFLPFFGPSPSPLTFHNVKNHGGGGAEGEPGNEEQKKTKKTTH